MARLIPSIPRYTVPAKSADLPIVRVDVRTGPGKPTQYDLAGEEFLIGSVPGCDLRLPGTNLPPVVCLIARQTDGVRLRKLAPTLPILVNGQPISQTAPTPLAHGDCISIGQSDILVSVDFALPAPQPILPPMSEVGIENPSIPTEVRDQIRREAEFLRSRIEQFEARRQSIELEDELRRQDLARLEKEMKERERSLQQQVHDLEEDRVLWYRRREEIERETQQARQEASGVDRLKEQLVGEETKLREGERELHRQTEELQRQRDELTRIREETFAQRQGIVDRHNREREDLHRLQEELEQKAAHLRAQEQAFEQELRTRRQAVEEELQRLREETEAEVRRWRGDGGQNLAELHDQIEKEILARYRTRTEELDRFQLSLREAAVQLRERKQALDQELSSNEPRTKVLAEREATLAAREKDLAAAREELGQQRETLDLEYRAREADYRRRDSELADRETALNARISRVAVDNETAEKGLAQYQADLVRLDRWQLNLDQKEQSLHQRALELDQRSEQMQRDLRDLEGQIFQVDAREEHLRAEEQRQAEQRRQLDERESRLNERTAQVEGQQVMFAAMRTKLEHRQEELQAEAARLSAERERLEQHTREGQEKLLEAQRLREEISGEQSHTQEAQRIYQERTALIQQAVERLRVLQKQVSDEDERLRALSEELDTKGADLAEREGLVQARHEQLLEQLRRLEADRDAVRQRESAIQQAEEVREALQEQLRRRAEELTVRQRELDEEARRQTERGDALAKLEHESSQTRRLTADEEATLIQRDEQLQQQSYKLAEAERLIAAQRQQLVEAQARFDAEQQAAELRIRQSREEIDSLRDVLAGQASEMLGQVPDLEQRALAALDKTTQARESLRSQLAEVHAYARQSQEELESLRSQVQQEIDRLRQQEQQFQRSRSEHRLTVASFRQQLVEWQSRFAEMRQSLSHSETRIEQRQKAVQTNTEELARKAEALQAVELEVAEKRSEVERHLHDMREWYRKKLRELVHSKGHATVNTDDAPTILPMPGVDAEPAAPAAESEGAILALQEDLDPADRNLGERLKSLELVDSDTLTALWQEARRQRRPLRQVLLAGSYLTLYQLALIESGQLDRLVLGRFRVIDRLSSTPREAIYRVFDPQGATGQDGVGLLRHLSEAEMQDAVHPDEYRQRFTALRDVAHPNLSATLEVLEINGRPAVLQEWPRGLPGSEFPIQVGSGGVWYRLLSQAALGLHTAHQAGLVHGRLSADDFLLSADGVLNVTGFGEPAWLYSSSPQNPEPAEDLKALGPIALGWAHLSTKRKGKKAFPEALHEILKGLGVAGENDIPSALYPTASALLEDLDRVASEIAGDSGSWEKLMQHVRDNSTEGPLLRKTA